MTFPTVEALTPTAFGTDDTAHLVGMPATVNSDDLLLIIFTNDGDATVTTPGGWSALGSLARGTTQRLTVLGRDADGTEDGTTVDVVTSAIEKAAAQTYRISGWGGNLATDVAISTGAIGTTNDADPDSLSPSWGAADTLWIACASLDGAAVVNTYPTNYTDGAAQQSGGGGADGTKVTVASARRQLNASSEDPGVFAIDGPNWVAFTVAVKPAATTPLYPPRLLPRGRLVPVRFRP